jgi:glycosyltransferase involved in cell wall biosynthesis
MLLNVVHIVKVSSIYGGHVISSIGISKSLSELNGLNISLYLDVRDELFKFSGLPKNTIIFNSKFPIKFFSNLYSSFRLAKPDIIHIHGAWSLITFLSCIYGYIFNIPFVIHPHGMLSIWALRHKSIKKNIAFSSYQKWCLINAKLIIATSLAEHNDICNLGFGDRSIVTEQGIRLLPLIGNLNVSRSSSRQRNLLFLSRLHPVKGIYELLEAWRVLKPIGWVLNVAGPDEDGNLIKIKNFIATHDLDKSINVLGPASDEMKSYLYSQADLFILPSHSENFGIVILEALSFGLPVITTKNTPWKVIEEQFCGWCIDMNMNKLIDTLLIAINLNDEERGKMGRRALKLASNYDLKSVATNIASQYQSLL